MFKYLDKHLALRVQAIGSAVYRHGLPVSGKLQGEFFLHQLFDNLRERSKQKMEIERERMWDVRSNKGETLLSLCVCVCWVVFSCFLGLPSDSTVYTQLSSPSGRRGVHTQALCNSAPVFSKKKCLAINKYRHSNVKN